jgi:PAS domain S-box-containing protein
LLRTGLVIALGLALSLTAFWVVWRTQQARDEAEFQRQISTYLAGFQERRNSIEDVLRGLRALFHQNPGLNRQQFHAAVEDLAIRTEGIQALAWVPRVPHDQRQAFEEAARQSGFPEFQFTEGDVIHIPEDKPVRARERLEYFPVIYLEPDTGNEHIVGYDLAATDVLPTLEAARDSGQIPISGKVRLRYGEAIRRAVVAVAAVYHPVLRPPTLQSRQQELQGFVIAVFFIDTMMASVEGRVPQLKLDVMILDASAQSNEDRLLGAHVREANGGGLVPGVTEEGFRQKPFFTRGISLGGREWELLFRRNSAWRFGPDRLNRFSILVSGLFFTGLLAQYLRNAARRTQEVEQLVEKRTNELQSANSRLEREIQEHLQTQNHLARERNLLRTLVNRLPDSVFLTDAQGRYLMFNDAHRRLLGLDQEEKALDKPVGQVGPDAIAQALNDGSAELLTAGEPVLNREYQLQLGPGKNRILEVSKLPLRNSADRVEGWLGIARDITEARHAQEEHEMIARRLQETQKLESLGLLAGGIAHDFNNLLTNMLGNASLARLDLPENSPAFECLEQIENTAVRAAELCKQMLAYSGKGKFIVRRLNLSKLVDETADLLRFSISKKAVLKLNLNPDLPAVIGDATQLRQILLNLAINASEAIGDRPGTIQISTTPVHLDRDQLATMMFASEYTDGQYVCLEVSDDGSGMDAEIQARIFDPFFSTKFTGRGLGLAAVLGIVRGHKGAIQLESAPGKGSLFKVFLPCTTDPADPDTTPLPARKTWRGKGTLLLVDDEQAVRSVTSRILKSFGFDVQTARDGREAIELFSGQPEKYQAVLLDLTMPRMDGEETFREMRRIQPGVRVLLMSGFSEQEALERFAGKGLDGFIQKPFNHEALRHNLQILLECPNSQELGQP